MTKAQQLKAQRVLLETLIKTHPEVQTFLNTLINKETVEQGDIIEPIIVEQLKQARIIGVNIGWQGAFLRCEEAIKDMSNAEEIKSYVTEEANKIRNGMRIKIEEKESVNEEV